jgi:hypothetical protein
MKHKVFFLVAPERQNQYQRTSTAKKHGIGLLGVPFFMDIIIIIAWSVWTTRNDWEFNEIDPPVDRCREKFISEFVKIFMRAQPASIPARETWISSL